MEMAKLETRAATEKVKPMQNEVRAAELGQQTSSMEKMKLKTQLRATMDRTQGVQNRKQ
jgi:hypothetical protein